MAIRSLNFFLLSLGVIFASQWAMLAGVNFGIIASCICISTPINCTLSFLFYGERLTKKALLGTGVVLSGVIWVSLSKSDGPDIALKESLALTDSDRDFYRICSILTALFVGCINALRTFQAKYVLKKSGYGPLDFSIDAGLFIGFTLMLLATYFSVLGHPGYTWYNILVSFAASLLLMLTSVMGLFAMVKGLAGPTSAILSTNSIVQTLLSAVFLGLIPTLMQAIGSVIAVGGVVCMMLIK